MKNQFSASGKYIPIFRPVLNQYYKMLLIFSPSITDIFYYQVLKARLLISLSFILLFLTINRSIYAQQMTDYNRQVFPPDHALNMPIDNLPVHPNSATYIKTIGADTRLHPDFGDTWDDEGTIRSMGIPYNVVGSEQPLRTITWTTFGDESDPGPWPIPANPYIEGVFDWRDNTEGDRHMLIVDSVANILYETGGVYGNASGTEWEGGCGAVFNLNNYDLRTETWTSADAAGLPIFPLLIRYDEVQKALSGDGFFHHAIRFTTEPTKKEYIWPARHYASDETNSKYPAMGQRFRLKANFDISAYSPRIQVILRSMKKYGLILADNGSNWFFQGTHDARWNGEELDELKNLHGSDFEAVDISEWMARPGFNINSAAVPEAGVSIENPAYSEQPVIEYYPNPFQNSTTIRFIIPESGKYTLKIYDISGKEVTVLTDKEYPAGEFQITWNGTDTRSIKLNSGIYFYSFSNQKTFIQTGKIIITD